MYNCIYIPMELAFNRLRDEKHLAHVVMDYMVDFLFFVDLVVNFRTTFYGPDYELVVDKKLIAKTYVFKGSFFLDLVAAFPFDVIFLAFDSDGGVSGVTGILKIPRLLRIARLLKKLDVVAAANALRIVVLLLFFLLIAHWFACLWWIVGYSEYQKDIDTFDGRTDPRTGGKCDTDECRLYVQELEYYDR